MHGNSLWWVRKVWINADVLNCRNFGHHKVCLASADHSLIPSFCRTSRFPKPLSSHLRCITYNERAIGPLPL